MKRLSSTLRLDFTLQLRSKLYVMGLGVAVFIGFVLRGFFNQEQLRVLLPALFLLALGSTTYLFLGGMVIFEKAERTLEAQKVTPLRVDEYLASKLATLSLFAALESVVVLAIAYGFSRVRILPLAAGLLVMGLLYTLIGLVQVARHDSVTEFLMPGAFVVSGLIHLPVIDHLGLWPSPLWYAWPSQAPLLLMRSAFTPVAPWQAAYAVGFSLLSLAVFYVWARRAFRRHLLMG